MNHVVLRARSARDWVGGMGATVERQGLEETPDMDGDCSSGVSDFNKFLQISSTSSSLWLSYFYFKTPTAEVEPGGLDVSLSLLYGGQTGQ